MKHHKLGQIIKGWVVTVGETLLCLVLGAILESLSVKKLDYEQFSFNGISEGHILVITCSNLDLISSNAAAGGNA